MAKIFLYWRS